MVIREAQIEDIQSMHLVRTSVVENVLSNPALVTHEDYEEYLTKRGKGWVCEIDSRTIGFGILDIKGNSIWALFIHPDFEKKGIGKKLHDIMMGWYFTRSRATIWLTTSPNTRAEAFYKAAGWKAVGFKENNEIKFEMGYKDWQKSIADNM